MRSVLHLVAVAVLSVVVPCWSASKAHVVTFGKPQLVKISIGSGEEQSLNVNVRPLYIDSKLKDFTTGTPHDVTDRQFVVQRAFRMNDLLPSDEPKQGRWTWQLGGWILVDRSSGRTTQLRLPDFEPQYSRVSWYRDYAAYCGISESGERWNAVVAQIGGRKAMFRKELGKMAEDAADPACELPRWERHPSRVTFSSNTADKFTVNVTARHSEELIDNTGEP